MKEIKVLIVDDKEVFREGLSRLLEEQNAIEVVGQCDSKQVIAEVKRAKPRLILMDTELAYSDVIEVIPQVSDSYPEVKVAMLTDSLDEAKLFSCVEAGASGYLVKNLSVDDLVESIDLIAKGRVVISPLLSNKFLGKFAELRGKEKSDEGGEGSDLSEREREILGLVADGYTNKEIAQKLFITENTAKVHVKNILQKLELRNRQQAAAYAAEHGLAPHADEENKGD